MLLITLIFGLNIPVLKLLLPNWISPEGLTLARILFGAISFWIASLFVKNEKLLKRDHSWMLLGALCGVVFNQGFFIAGLNNTSPIDASIIITSGPLFAMIFAAIILKEPISILKISGIVVGALGAILLVSSAHHSPHTAQSTLKGNFYILASAMIYAFYLVITKPLTTRYSPITLMKWMFLYGAIMVTPFYLPGLISATVLHHPEPLSFLLLVYTMIAATFFAYLLIPMAQKRLRPTTISMYNNLQPLVATFAAIMVGMDHITIVKVFSALLIFGGVYLVTRSKSREGQGVTEDKKG